ncbi:universal stress protein [Streptomyces sp. NPDC006339]|uniref:universal stress protein n=1 Tax=Streptomyces sp. NPDC006339 TaxID=3156755 RepID=UPI0033BA4FAD
MAGCVVVGLDGTEQADAAAEWAADEAVLRGTGVHLVHVLEPSPDALVPLVSREPVASWGEELLARTAAGLRARHPGLSVTTRLLPSDPVTSLVLATEERGDLLVLGSRALGGVAGYLLGSVGMTVAGRIERPVVLVRASHPPGPEDAGPATAAADAGAFADGPETSAAGPGASAVAQGPADGDGPVDAGGPVDSGGPVEGGGRGVVPGAPDLGGGPVVVGIDPRDPVDGILEFAFAEAAWRGAEVRVFHARRPSLHDRLVASGASEARRAPAISPEVKRSLDGLVEPWRERFPDVSATGRVVAGSAGQVLSRAAEGAALVVIGRRTRRSTLGAHLGSVAHAVLHHVRAPVAVVPHD